MLIIELELEPEYLYFVQKLMHALVLTLKPGKEKRQILIKVDTKHPRADEEMKAIWDKELATQIREDIMRLVNFVNKIKSKYWRGVLAPQSAESILKGASYLRTRAREVWLNNISDATLESGSSDLATLSPLEQEAYTIYTFLAYLQELLIHKLQEV